MAKVKVSDIVVYNNGGKQEAAIVVNVLGGNDQTQSVNLRVFSDSSENPKHFTSVAIGKADESGRWCWPDQSVDPAEYNPDLLPQENRGRPQTPAERARTAPGTARVTPDRTNPTPQEHRPTVPRGEESRFTERTEPASQKELTEDIASLPPGQKEGL